MRLQKTNCLAQFIRFKFSIVILSKGLQLRMLISNEDLRIRPKVVRPEYKKLFNMNMKSSAARYKKLRQKTITP